MAVELPYMPSVTNLPAILDRIRSAGTPPRFTHDFLKASLGFASSNDRAVIKILRQLRFLTSDGAPTPRYNEYRGEKGGLALADGLREGWAPLFLANNKVHDLSRTELIGIVKNVTGAGDAVAQKMQATFKALADKADWAEGRESSVRTPVAEVVDESPPVADIDQAAGAAPQQMSSAGLQLHQDVHVHLPPTSDVAVYRAIFRAIKEELL